MTSLVALGAVLGCAVVLRLLFVTGIVHVDDLGYSQAARDLLGGNFRLQPWPAGQMRVGLYAPVALCYLLFGTSETSALVFPFVCSLGTILLVYAIARDLADERAGLIAAFVWAVTPVDIRSATALLPEAPVTMFTAASVWLFLRADAAGGRARRMYYAATAFVLGLAVLVKPVALIVAPFFVVRLLTKHHEAAFGRRGRAVAAALAVCVVVYAAFTYVAAFARFMPLAIVAFVALPGLGSIALLSFAVVSGVYLARVAGVTATRYAVAACAVVVSILAIVGMRNGPWLSWAVLGVDPSALPLTRLGEIMLGVALFGAVGSAAIVSRMRRDRDRPPAAFAREPLGTVFLTVLLSAIGIASLHPAQMATLELRDGWHDNFKAVAETLRTRPRLPIYLQNKVAAARLDVAWHHTARFDFWNPVSPASRVRVAPDDPASMGRDALVVVDDEHLAVSGEAGWGEGPAYLRNVPANWRLVFETGRSRGHRTRVYRTGALNVSAELDEARQGVATAQSAANWRRLAAAAFAAGRPCEALSALLHVDELVSSADVEWAGVVGKSCYEQHPRLAGQNLVVNGDFSAGLDGWVQMPDARATRTTETDAAGKGVAHVRFDGGNWAVLTQNVTLAPDTAYVYRMRVKTTTPVEALYWQADEGHAYQSGQVYEEWTDLVSVFITPHWRMRRGLPISPVLPTKPGDVWVADVQVRPIELVGR